MAALTANLMAKGRYKALDGLTQYTYPVADAVEIFEGALIGLTADGYAAPITTTDCYGFLGVATEGVDNSSGANGALKVVVTCPPFLSAGILADLTMADEDIGSAVGVATDNPADITLSPISTSTILGRLDRLEGGVANVFLVRCEYAGVPSGAVIAAITATTTLILKDAAGSGEVRVRPRNGFGLVNISPDAARTIVLPDAALALANCQQIMIANIAGSAWALTVTNAAAGTIAVIDQDQIGMFASDGASWHGGIMPEA